MTTTPAAVEALKLANEVKRLAISAAERYAKVYFWKNTGLGYNQEAELYEAERVKLFSAIDALAALAHQSPPTGVSGSQAKSEAVALLTVAREDDPTWRGMNFIGLTEHGKTLAAGKYELYAAPQEAVERQPLTGWISVDERLPEENMPVLVTKDGGHEYIDLDVMEEGVWRDWCEYVEHVEVIGGRTSDVKLYTHWAPIPCGIGPATQEKQHG